MPFWGWGKGWDARRCFWCLSTKRSFPDWIPVGFYNVTKSTFCNALIANIFKFSQLEFKSEMIKFFLCFLMVGTSEKRRPRPTWQRPSGIHVRCGVIQKPTKVLGGQIDQMESNQLDEPQNFNEFRGACSNKTNPTEKAWLDITQEKCPIISSH